MYVSHCTVLLMFTGVLFKKKLKKTKSQLCSCFSMKRKKKESDQGCGGDCGLNIAEMTFRMPVCGFINNKQMHLHFIIYS